MRDFPQHGRMAALEAALGAFPGAPLDAAWHCDRPHGRMASLEAALVGTPCAAPEAFSGLAAEIAAAAWHSKVFADLHLVMRHDLHQPARMASLEAALVGSAAECHCNRPKPAPRATDKLFEDLDLLIRYQRLGHNEPSDTGAFQEAIRSIERQREFFDRIAEPYRLPFASEFDRPSNSPDNNRLATPDDPSPIASRAPYRPPLPVGRFPDLEEKFKSLPPGLTRDQQYEAVCNSPEFARYHLTVRVLRAAAKVVPVPRGRPRRR